MRGQRENFRKAVQSFEIKKRKIDIYGNYEDNGVEKNQRKFEIFSTLISKKSIFCFHTAYAFQLIIPNKAFCWRIEFEIGSFLQHVFFMSPTKRGGGKL